MTIDLIGRPDVFEGGQRIRTEKGLRAKFVDGYCRTEDDETIALMMKQPNFDSPNVSRRFTLLSDEEVALMDRTRLAKQDVRSAGPTSDQAAKVTYLEERIKKLEALVAAQLKPAPAAPAVDSVTQAMAEAASKGAEAPSGPEVVEEDEKPAVAPKLVEKPRVDYTSFKKEKLIHMLRERKLRTDGKCDDLIARLVNWDNEKQGVSS